MTGRFPLINFKPNRITENCLQKLASESRKRYKVWISPRKFTQKIVGEHAVVSVILERARFVWNRDATLLFHAVYPEDRAGPGPVTGIQMSVKCSFDFIWWKLDQSHPDVPTALDWFNVIGFGCPFANRFQVNSLLVEEIGSFKAWRRLSGSFERNFWLLRALGFWIYSYPLRMTETQKWPEPQAANPISFRSKLCNEKVATKLDLQNVSRQLNFRKW